MFTYSINQAHEIRKVHVVVVQQRLRNEQKSIMHMQSCCFACLNLCLFCCSPSSLQNLPIVVIQKFYYHGNMTPQFTSPFSYLFSLLHNLIFNYFNQWLLSFPSSSTACLFTPLLWNKVLAETYDTCLTPYLALL